MGLDALASFFERIDAQQRESDKQNEERARTVEAGGFVWVCEFRPHEVADLLEDEHGFINGQARWRWRRYHKKERFYRRASSLRPVCAARCRSGQPCRARVCLRADGSTGKRCRLHGGLSTGPKTPQPKQKDSPRTRAQLWFAIQNGATVREACKAAGITPTTLYRWIEADVYTFAAYRVACDERDKKARANSAK